MNAKDNYGENVLTLASINGHFELVELFINLGCDVNQKNNNNQSPLYMARLNAHANIEELLVSRGATL